MPPIEVRVGRGERGEQGMDRGAGDCRSLPKSLKKSYPPSLAMFSPTCKNDKLEMPSARLVRELPASERVMWFCRHSGQLNEASSSLSKHLWKIHLLTHSLWKQCEHANVLNSSPSAYGFRQIEQVGRFSSSSGWFGELLDRSDLLPTEDAE